MRADNSRHLTTAARQRAEQTRARAFDLVWLGVLILTPGVGVPAGPVCPAFPLRSRLGLCPRSCGSPPGANSARLPERRWRAAREAGLSSLPAVIRTTEDTGPTGTEVEKPGRPAQLARPHPGSRSERRARQDQTRGRGSVRLAAGRRWSDVVSCQLASAAPAGSLSISPIILSRLAPHARRRGNKSSRGGCLSRSELRVERFQMLRLQLVQSMAAEVGHDPIADVAAGGGQRARPQSRRRDRVEPISQPHVERRRETVGADFQTGFLLVQDAAELAGYLGAGAPRQVLPPPLAVAPAEIDHGSPAARVVPVDRALAAAALASLARHHRRPPVRPRSVSSAVR